MMLCPLCNNYFQSQSVKFVKLYRGNDVLKVCLDYYAKETDGVKL